MEEKVTTINNAETGEVSVKELILKIGRCKRYILSKWVVVISVSILGSALGLIVALLSKPVYTATTIFVLEDGEKGGGALGQYSGLASMVGVDIGGGGGGIFQGDNILELYKSRTMIEKTLLTKVEYNHKKELLVDRYIAFNKLREKWVKYPELKNINFNEADSNRVKYLRPSFTRLQDSVLGSIVYEINKNNLNVIKPDKKLSIIKVEVKSEDEFFAKAFNDQIVKNVNDFYVHTKTKKSIENVAILQQKTDSVRAVMNGAIYSGAVALDATPNLNPTRQIQRTAPVQRSQFTAESNKTVLGELVKNLELSKITLRKETPLIQVVDEPIMPLYKQNLGKTSGVIFGGILAGFLCVIFLLAKKMFKTILE